LIPRRNLLALLLALHFSHGILLCRKPVEAGNAAWDRVETVASDFLLLNRPKWFHSVLALVFMPLNIRAIIRSSANRLLCKA
jgi:hypothetical protein